MRIKTLQKIQFEGNEEQSILDDALNAGFFFEYSCKNGQCGVCKTNLLEGEVIELQAQIALSDADRINQKILSCCCAPKTDILIDAEDLRELKGIEVKTFPARINKIEKKTEQIIELELRLPPATKFNFLEGQFVDVIGPEGIRRSYSLANSASNKSISLFIKKVKEGQLSQYWFNEARKNDLLRIEGPKGTFFFREIKDHVVFLATGTGIAPIKSILDKLSELSSELSFSLYWGNRNPDDFFWQPDYKNLNLKYTPVLSRNHENWADKIGYVQNIVIEDYGNLESVQVYACGSLEMIESAKELFVKNGLEEKFYHSDAFVSS